jgi:hypothetical protein
MKHSRILTGAIALLFGCFLPATPLAAMQASQAPPKKARKVWTNEDLEALRSTVRLSEAGTATEAAVTTAPAKAEPAESGAPEKPAAPDANALNLERLQKRMTSLREELAAIEEQLRSLRSPGSAGRTTGQGLGINQTPGGLTTENQISQLEARRRQIQQQMEAAEEEARRLGFTPGQLR